MVADLGRTDARIDPDEEDADRRPDPIAKRR